MNKKLQKKRLNKNILIGICGSIAAYKVCDLIRILKENNFEVKCILTEEGEKFITPLTLQTLTCNPVYTELFVSQNFQPEHISVADWADIVVIAPATANIIAHIAAGFADKLLSCVVLATKAPVLICPAMNSNMWLNPITQENVKKLQKLGYRFLGPDKGELVCGRKGIGRLISVDKIFQELTSFFQEKKKDKQRKSHT
ncbi:MAG: flavoprotein [Elusimicrobiota bacterium]|nr:flavoprotein [Elusimicrobiota bacterium]